MTDKWQVKNNIVFKPIEFDEIDELAKNNTIITLKNYKKWNDNIKNFDSGNRLRKKINDFHKSLGHPSFDFLLIDNTWHHFNSIDNFLNIGIPQLPDMCNSIWISGRRGEKFLKNKLYFLPLTKRISAIVAIYE